MKKNPRLKSLVNRKNVTTAEAMTDTAKAMLINIVAGYSMGQMLQNAPNAFLVMQHASNPLHDDLRVILSDWTLEDVMRFGIWLRHERARRYVVRDPFLKKLFQSARK
jgi:hypothetical protein